jgi:penicillin-binding protein 1A
MSKPFTAGERLAPVASRSLPSRKPPAEPPAAAPPAAAPPPPRGRLPERGPPRRPPFRWLRRIAAVLMALFVLATGAAGMAGWAAYKHFSRDLPDVDGLRTYQPRVMSRVYAGDSRLLAELATERRIFVPYSAIPEIVKRAFVSAEDQNFFTHRGVDPLAMARAAVTDARQYGQGRRPIGASTITQQVAKNMLLGNEVSVARKVKEIILALRIEQALTKEKILELYLNEIYLGLSAYGVASAAQTYFNKSLDELTIAEAAFLAALPKAPNNYNPLRFPDAARARRDWVLDRMAEDGVINAVQHDAAKAAPIVPSPFRRPDQVQGGDYFAEEVRRQLIDRFGADQTTQGGLVVRTSLDPALQAEADKVLHEGLVKYDQKRGGWRGPFAKLAATPALRINWAAGLAALGKPPGLLPEWRLAVVLQETDAEARLGFLEHPPGAVAAVPRVLPLSLAEAAWARPVKDGNLGPAPRKISDIMQVGDVVMAELAPATAAQGKTIGKPERLLLRQIPIVQGALVAIDPATGRVLALSGGWSFEMSQFDRATQANRQPGSSFKPFVYLTALEQGISPSQRFMDAPFVVDQGAAGKWRPGNYELDFNGPVPLHVALEKSLNLVTVRVADKVGMEAVAQTAGAFHIVDNLPRLLPAALGAVETTVLREAAAYAGIAADGREVVPTLIDSVQDRDGHELWSAPGIACQGCADPAQPPQLLDNRRQIADPQSIFQLNLMMQGVVQHGTGTNAGVGLNRQIAGKTGTSQDFQDAWFSGFTPDLVTTVWIGYDTPTSLGNNETGGAIAAPVWHDFMAFALKNRPKLAFPQPPGVTVATYEGGFGPVTDAFKAGQEPGGSGPIGGPAPGEAAATASDAGATAGTATAGGAPPAPAAGVDSGMGGLY